MREEQVESEGQGLGKRPACPLGMSGGGSKLALGLRWPGASSSPPPASTHGAVTGTRLPQGGARSSYPVTRSGFEGHGEDRSQDLETC